MRKCHFLNAKTSETLSSLELLAPSWVPLAGFWSFPALDSPRSKGGSEPATPVAAPHPHPLASLGTGQDKGFLPQRQIGSTTRWPGRAWDPGRRVGPGKACFLQHCWLVSRGLQATLLTVPSGCNLNAAGWGEGSPSSPSSPSHQHDVVMFFPWVPVLAAPLPAVGSGVILNMNLSKPPFLPL